MWKSNKNSSPDINFIHQEHMKEDRTTNGIHGFRSNGNGMRSINDDDSPMSLRGCGLCRHRSLDNSSCFPSENSGSRNNASRKINHPASSKSCDFIPTPSSSWNSSGSFRMPPHDLKSRNASRKRDTPIMYSNSSGMLKPPPIEKRLECTLEDLCYGCKKKIMITRDVLTDTGLVSNFIFIQSLHVMSFICMCSLFLSSFWFSQFSVCQCICQNISRESPVNILWFLFESILAG